MDVCHHYEYASFSTGYDRLVARIMAMLYACRTERRRCCWQRTGDYIPGLLNLEGGFKWTGTLVKLVEWVYGLQKMGCINDGEAAISEPTVYLGRLLGLEIKDSHCCHVYPDMKRCKSESRTYFLDKLRE